MVVVILNRLIELYLKQLEKENITDHIGIMKIRYVLIALMSEFVKTIILFMVFLFLGQGVLFLITLLLILPIRMTTGGIHFNGHLSCFISSLIYFILVITLLPMLPLKDFIYQLILIFSTILIMVFPLAPSAKRPIISKKKYLKNKMISITYLSIYVIIFLFFIKNQSLIKTATWALFLQAIELNIIVLFRKKEK